MSVLHLVNSVNRVVITRCSGVVSRTEIEASFAELRKHPDFKPEFHQLADLSEVSNLDLHFADMEVIRRDDPFSRKARRAVVAPGSGTTFGLARMYQSMVDSAEFEVFQSMADAIVWLGFEITTLQPASTKKQVTVRKAQPKKRGKGSTG